jgi:hypothetical protein
MEVKEAQREVRSVFLGGSVGQMVSAALWLGSAALSTWASTRAGILFIVLGGVLIFPTTQLVLWLIQRRASLSAANPLGALAMQIAFTVPLTLPLAGAAALHRLSWFYPACMIIVGAHYLPFVFLYGMWQFGVLAGLMVAGGLLLGLYVPGPFALGGWITGALLLAFGAFVLAARAFAAACEPQRT